MNNEQKDNKDNNKDIKPEDIEKIYKIRDQLLITYKASINPEQKKRIGNELKQIEAIIKDIEEGKWVNPVKLNIIGESTKYTKTEAKQSNVQKKYKDIIEIVKITENNKDYELDLLYSYIMFFERNFLPPLSQSYLKVDYSLSKKRDDFFVHYDTVKHLIDEFINDLNVLCKIKLNEQFEKYKERISQQKKYLLIQVRSLLDQIKNFLDNVIDDLNEGRKSLFNAEEKFINKYGLREKSIFEGKSFSEIVLEAQIFINEFIDIIRMPDFKKKTQ